MLHSSRSVEQIAAIDVFRLAPQHLRAASSLRLPREHADLAVSPVLVRGAGARFCRKDGRSTEHRRGERSDADASPRQRQGLDRPSERGRRCLYGKGCIRHDETLNKQGYTNLGREDGAASDKWSGPSALDPALPFDDGDVAIDRQAGEAFHAAAGWGPLDFDPVHFRCRTEAEYFTHVVR